jgi:hypothetical protein
MGRAQASYHFGLWILKALPVASFKNSNVANLNPNGITYQPHADVGFHPSTEPTQDLS